MKDLNKIKVGLGFATGRKSFQKVLKTYMYNWRQCGTPEKDNVHLSILVAYDLKYANTKLTDYTNIRAEVRDTIDDAYFIGSAKMREEIAGLMAAHVLEAKEADLLFGHGGYAAKRNAVLYFALKNQIDYLIFLDDDEYPMAVTKTRTTSIWGGQHVISVHLQHIDNADITNGYHCGYVSPIPQIGFNTQMTEYDFRLFIEAISNDIIEWDSLKATMDNGGVTYADTKILVSDNGIEVPEINHTKFISGANLCINLTDPERVHPFYNPPGARGEDTFLSTCLGDKKVLRVPCYTFHDGFSTYRSLMDGVLPIRLKEISADNAQVVTRFYQACIGWIRYKPLLLYITDREHYEDRIAAMRQQLAASLPKVCAYFGRDDFINIGKELERYHKNVKKHHRNFCEIQEIWQKITCYLGQDQ